MSEKDSRELPFIIASGGRGGAHSALCRARGARREMKENYWPTWSIFIIVVRFECPRIGLVPENVFSPRFTSAKKFSPGTRRDRVCQTCQTLPNIIINYVIICTYSRICKNLVILSTTEYENYCKIELRTRSFF